KDKNNYWVGLEYFCTKNDRLWNMPEDEFKLMAISELEKIGFSSREDVLDSIVVKMENTYPVYAGTYKDFYKIKEFVDTIPNLFLIGRNGMHRYNNMDHAILSAKAAVKNIVSGKTDKDNIWNINIEQDYLEQKDGPKT
ncbi:MAG: hypothetical protein PHQ52_02260, partial [Candidatus Omnitrophica bacterium]|nr:hypothetical protein [Candidatus Omnitrophota bacterium]